MLTYKMKNIIDNLHFHLTETPQDDDMVVSINQFTPAGEDWWVEFVTDGTDADFYKQLYDYWDGFDVDEEVELWIPSRGKNGVPSSISTLLHDAEWKQTALRELINAIQNEDVLGEDDEC